MTRFGFSRNVWLLGWVSLATDAATEAIYPLLPFFLTTVLGASAVSLGIIEGAAEATNSVLKILAGRAADRTGRRRLIVLVGYAISSAVRPLIAVAASWTHVFTVRVVDRVGKGIRGAPRDAMLASFATPTTRGKIYGFHRAMDHTGAVVGPILATVFLYFYPGQYRALFAMTLVPGVIAVGLIFLVREEQERLRPFEPEDKEVRGRESASVRAGGGAPAPLEKKLAEKSQLTRELKAFFVVLALFTLGNSTDAFLILKLTDAAGSTVWIPMIWAALHVVKATVSVVGGSWSDRIGRRAVIAIGWIIYAFVYVGFAFAQSLTALLAFFLVYGLYFGFTEGTEKALVADLAPASQRGLAFGIYNAVLGAGGLVASVLFGILWTTFGPAIAFTTGAALALAATALLYAVVTR